MNDLIFSGAGASQGGEYDRIKISGSGKITGDVVCTELAISGSGKLGGDVECSGDVRVSGFARFEGGVEAKEEFRCSGACRIHGDLKADKIRASGSLHVEGEISAENIELSGGVHCEGLMSAEKILIRLEDSNTSIGSIGGTDIRVEKRKRHGCLRTDSIEGDTIYLEGVTCGSVCGRDVVIGPDCEIGRVEHTGTIQISDKAVVKEPV